MKMNLHYFDENGGNDNGVNNDNGGGAVTFDDMLKGNSEYQSEFDRRISKALETARGKMQEEMKSKIEEAKNEATRLAKMNAEEKAKHEAEKRENALTEREKAVAKRELMIEAAGMLKEKNLPAELADILNYVDADECKKSIESVEKAFTAAVEKSVNEKLKGGTMKKAPESNETDLERLFKEQMGIRY